MLSDRSPHNVLLLLVIATVLLFSGCISYPPLSPVDGQPLDLMARLGDTGLFRAEKKGEVIAYVDNALFLLDRRTGTLRTLSEDSPSHLAWHPDSRQFAAGFVGTDQTTIRVYNLEGSLLQEQSVPIIVTQLLWSSRGDLLAVGHMLTVYSFGGNLVQSLYRLDEQEMTRVLLGDQTLKPHTAAQLGRQLGEILSVAFSPSGDELVYLRLHDPPEFPPYFVLVHRNWQVGHERRLNEIPLARFTLAWSHLEDSVSLSNDRSEQWVIPLWGEAGVATAERNATEGVRYTTGALYPASSLGVESQEGAKIQLFSGGRFLLAQDSRLYSGDGLEHELIDFDFDERSWMLRKWRFEGLIAPNELQNRSGE